MILYIEAVIDYFLLINGLYISLRKTSSNKSFFFYVGILCFYNFLWKTHKIKKKSPLEFIILSN